MRMTIKIPLNWFGYILVTNVVLFLLLGVLALLTPVDFSVIFSRLLISFGALSGLQVMQDGEIWRMVTSLFLHVDFLHLAFNMLAFYQLGRVIYEYYGSKMLLVFYLWTGLAGSLLSIVFLSQLVPTVGASGAVFGLIGVLVAGSAKRTKYGVELPFRTQDILPLAIYAFIFGLLPNSGVNNFAHLGGFLAGLAFGWFFSHQMVSWKSKQSKFAEQALYYLSLVILALSAAALAFNLFSAFTA